MRRATSLLILALLLPLLRPTPAVGQGAEPLGQQTLSLDNVRAAFCVEFLVDPATTTRLMPSGFTGARADATPWAGSVVRQIVAERPDSFGAWTPAHLCVQYAEAMQWGSNRYVDKKKGRARAIAVLGLAGRRAAAPESGAPSMVAARLMSNEWKANGLMGREGLDVERFAASISKLMMESDSGMVPRLDDRYEIKLDGMTLIWDGRVGQDGRKPTEPLERSWVALGKQRSMWTVRSSLQPEGQRPMSGALSILGNDLLARTLRASPVRALGMVAWGGSGRIQFSGTTAAESR